MAVNGTTGSSESLFEAVKKADKARSKSDRLRSFFRRISRRGAKSIWMRNAQGEDPVSLAFLGLVALALPPSVAALWEGIWKISLLLQGPPVCEVPH